MSPRALVLSALLALGLVGCKPAATEPPPAALTAQAPNEFTTELKTLLTQHGEKKIVVKGAAVGVEGKPTLFSARTYGVNTKDSATTAEIEFLTTLPDGRVIQDFVAGMSGDEKAAKADAVANFVLTTFHVLYSALINPSDPHLPAQKETVHGKVRDFYVGDVYVRGKSADAKAFKTIGAYAVEQIKANLPDDTKTHWIKVVYGASKDEVLTAETTLDGEPNAPLNEALKKAAWPKTESVYIFKLFVLVRGLDS